MRRILGLWHLASLDAPTVAVVWTLAFAWAERVRLRPWTPLAVALVVWSTYVADRLLDARTGLREPTRRRLRERHFFHWGHRRALLPLAAGAAFAAAGIVLALMPPAARARGSVLAAAALVYFSGVHSQRFGERLPFGWPRSLPSKEFLVGILFTAGCALAAWGRTHRLNAWSVWIPAAGFAALAWLNCTSISRWEAMGESLPQGEQQAACRWRALLSVRALAVLLAASDLMGAVLGFAPHPRSAALLSAAAASALLLALLDCVRTRMTPLALRSAADLVLLTPAALLLMARVLG